MQTSYQDDLRVDGRGCEDYRHMEIETDVVSNTDGSAKVTLVSQLMTGVRSSQASIEVSYRLIEFIHCIPNVIYHVM